MKRILRRPVVESKTGLKHSEIYERIKKLTFPRPVPLGPKAVGWLEEEIDQWIDQRTAERDARVERVNPAPAASAAAARTEAAGELEDPNTMKLKTRRDLTTAAGRRTQIGERLWRAKI